MLAGTRGWFRGDWRGLRLGFFYGLWALLLLVLIPVEDNHPGSAQTAYDHAWKLFVHGKLANSQHEAEEGYKQFRISSPEWAAKFQLLEAEAMVRRGMYNDALGLLADYHDDTNHPEETIHKLTTEADALTSQQQFFAADQRLTEAEVLCKNADYASCGFVLNERGILAVMQGQVVRANHFFLGCLSFAKAHKDRFLEDRAALNLGWASLQIDHYDQAAEWSMYAYRVASDLGANNLTQAASGNLGWAYYQLGDDERALEQFLQAEKSAKELDNISDELKWISEIGYIYHDTGDLTRAAQSYRQALDLARKINSKEYILNELADMAQISVETEKLNEASAYLDQVATMENAGGIRLRAYVTLTQGMLAAARRHDQQAKRLFRAIQNNAANPISSRLTAGDQLARLFERRGNTGEAEQIYKATLATFESARAQLKREDSLLSFSANAMGIYDDYIRLLVRLGRSDEALAIADQSRAQTLAQGLGLTGDSFHPEALDPRRIARKTGATLLFYWLGEKQSYLWTITPSRITLAPLPARAEIVARVMRYRHALLDMEDPLQTRNDDGQALYQLLVAPAAKLLRRNAQVIILADGALSQLNFETLLAPGPGIHYWIDDAVLLSAPSLATLAAAQPARAVGRRLLLLGDPASPTEEYPSLPHFSFEMAQIERHFAARRQTVFAGRQATPAAYLASNPAQYSYIHFVAHATASRTDPLDSAIILSRGQTSDGAFKLYARDIMQRPIDARLVTLSACYGSGARAYAGEGLVGLSWAFLRAGAQNVIGALWEVSDDSTPRLMDAFYQGIEDGKAPAIALRNAKLLLLHSRTSSSLPFDWAPFQIYTRR